MGTSSTCSCCSSSWPIGGVDSICTSYSSVLKWYHMKYGLLFKLINTGIFSLQSSGRKKLRHPSLIQHYSQDLFSWRGQSAMTIPNGKTTLSLSVHCPFTSHSVLSSTYSVPNELLQKHHTVTKTHFHRFPFHHLFPPPGLDKPTTQTTCWANESSVTPLWVLAATQKPLPKRNTWKYSYKFR